MVTKEKIVRHPNLSILAMFSFIATFAVTRAFTTLNPRTVLISGGYHIHHFWYGLAMIAVGGWLGISYQSERIDRLAAIIFGAGGGLVGDEVGLLLTFGDYWTEVTYTLVVIFLAFASVLILINRYSRTIRIEFSHFAKTNASLYFGVLLAIVSVAFLLETDSQPIIMISGASALAACVVILAYFIQRIRGRQTRQGNNAKIKAICGLQRTGTREETEIGQT